MLWLTCSDYAHVLSTFAHEAMGAADAPGIPCSLFLLRAAGANSGAIARRECVRAPRVVARSGATKQSRVVYAAPMDCFAEPVIGPRFARTRWLAMTGSAV
jgi:hypothetical protein